MAGERLDRRTFLKGAGGALVAGGLLAACGSSSGGSTPSSSSSGAMFGGKPKSGGHLNFATWSEVDGFDPTANRWDQTGYAYARTVYDPLGAYDSSGKVQPYLAQSITPNHDFTQWTVTLRPNVVYHDGAPLDGAGVATFADKILSSALTGFAYDQVASASASGPMSVLFKTKIPWPSFDEFLADGQLAYPPSPNYWNKPNRSSNPIGTGPFVFQDWEPNNHFYAVRNKHYWRPGHPYLDAITFRPIPDTQSESSSLLAGNVDAMYEGATDQIVQFRNNSSYFYFDDAHPSIASYNPTSSFFMVNCLKPPLDDVRLRRALAAATDQKKLIDVTYNGVGTPTNGPFPKTSPYYQSDTGYPAFNLNEAKKLVKEVVKDKGPISIQLGTVNNPKDISITQLTQQMWEAAGIKVSLVQAEQATFINNALEGKFDVYTYLLFGGVNFDEEYVWLSSKNAQPIGQISLNFARYKDAQLQAALDKGRQSSDQSTRIAAYKTVGSRLGAGCPYIWVTPVLAATITSKKVHNIAGTAIPGGHQGFRAGGSVFPGDMWMST